MMGYRLNLKLEYLDLILNNYKLQNVYGGFNGNGAWITYLTQIAIIIQALDAWVIDLTNDCPDDVWVLRIGVWK